MAYVFDIALLVISGCSALYCWMLSRRLRALQNLRKGMGKAMVNLTKSVSSVESNAAKLNREATTAVVELKDVLSRVDSAEGKVDVLLETMDRQAREQWKDYRAKADDANQSVDTTAQSLKELIDDAKTMASLMNNQLITLANANEQLQKATIAATQQKQAMERAVDKAGDAAAAKVAAAVAKARPAVPGRAAAKLTPAQKPAPAHEVAALVDEQRAADRAVAYNAEKAAKLAALRKAARAGIAQKIAQGQAAKMAEPAIEAPATAAAMPPAAQQTPLSAQKSLAAVAKGVDKAAPRVAAVARKMAKSSDGEALIVSGDDTPVRRKRTTQGATNPFSASAMKRAAS